MRRLLALAAIFVALFAAASPVATSSAASGSCSDSWGSDGHSGPWYVGSNQSLHGNTVVVTCTGGSVPWSVDYQVCKSSGTSCDFTPINARQSGTGSTSFNISQAGVGCNQGWNYWTHVHNVDSGGDISKPADHTDVIC